MVKHPRHYPWWSYGANALGQTDTLVTPHELYRRWGIDPTSARPRIRACTHIDPETLDDIRQATQKGWALRNDRFKDEIERLLDRRTRPLPRGGDRRSVAYREGCE